MGVITVVEKSQNGYRKWIVRKITQGKVWEAIQSPRHKVGFYVEQADRIERGTGTAMRQALRTRLARAMGSFDPNAKVNEPLSKARLKQRVKTLVLSIFP